MPEELETPEAQPAESQPEVKAEAPPEVKAEPTPEAKAEATPEAAPETKSEPKPAQAARPPAGPRPPQGQNPNKGPRDNRPPNRDGKSKVENRNGGENRGERREGRTGPPNRDDRRPGGRFDLPPEIDLEKLVADSLYLDNQAHAIVSRVRDMDSGTRSQLRRFYNAVRRATSTPESERQHQFVMLRARLAYTIARHGLRSLDQLERLLLQVTRKNEARGYERFRDLFEAIVAYNE